MTQQQQRKSQPARQKSKRKRGQARKKGVHQADRPALESNAAGVDIGAREIFVAVPGDRDPEPVRVYQTFTESLQQLADWLLECRITTVAMESTGVFWIPLYQILEARGLRVCLVNARHMKNVPGKRTDWHECQWIQWLHSVGLLRASFRPQAPICAIRSLLRHREELVEMSSRHVLHMHKALTQMNVQLQHVISDLTGQTGMAIVEAILAGQRDAVELAKLRDSRIKASAETIRQSLAGDWKREHLFTLRQSLQGYGWCQEKVTEVDREIQAHLAQIESKVDPQAQGYQPAPRQRKKKPSQEPPFDLRGELYRVYGIDVTRIPGIHTLVGYRVLGELGPDLSAFPSAEHFASFLTLCPDNDISGGKILWRGVRRVKQRAAQAFRLAAHSLHRSQTYLGHFLRRMKAKLGPAGAITATAHKIAVIFYTLVTKRIEYDESVFADREAERLRRQEAHLRKKAAALGYQLVPASA
jgi:transposase